MSSGFTWSEWVWMGLTGSYSVLLGFKSLTRSYLVFQGLSGSYPVFLVNSAIILTLWEVYWFIVSSPFFRAFKASMWCIVMCEQYVIWCERVLFLYVGNSVHCARFSAHFAESQKTMCLLRAVNALIFSWRYFCI